MRPRYGVIVLAGGLLAAMLSLVVPAVAENPMTPLRPAAPPGSADRAAASSASASGAVRPVPAEAVTPAQRSVGPETAPPAPTAAPPGLPGEAATTDTAAAATPRARRSPRRDRAAGGLKPGRWEFTARLQPPTAAQAAVVRAAADGMQSTYSACIDADNAVPADLGPQCRLERHERRGSRISWSMTCSNTGVRSEGLAQYRGDTMHAAVVSHIPAANGKVTDMTQNLTGRYLGPCLPPAATTAPSGPAPANGPSASADAPSPAGSTCGGTATCGSRGAATRAFREAATARSCAGCSMASAFLRESTT